MTAQVYTAKWVLPISSPPIRDGAVAVEGGRIVFVGTRGDANSRPEYRDVETIDFDRAAILPGFVNCHSHLELTVMRGFLEDLSFREWIVKLTTTKYNQLTADDLNASALLGTAEAIRAGITTVADTGDSIAAFEAMLESGLRGIAFREVFGPDPNQAAHSIERLRQQVEEMRPRDSARVRTGISPHAPYTVSANLFRSVARYATSESLDVCIHAAESGAETELMMIGAGEFAKGLAARGISWEPPGVSTIEYFESLGVLDCRPLLVHCVQVGEKDIDMLAAHGARVAHCPKSNAKLGHGIAPLGSMLDSGVTVGLGSDSVASNNRCDMIEEARFCGLLHRAVMIDFKNPSAEYLLRLATMDSARALGLDAEVGSLEVGKQADFIAIDLSRSHNAPVHDPIAAIIFSADSSDVLFTAVAGQVLFDRQLRTIDEGELQNRVNEVMTRM